MRSSEPSVQPSNARRGMQAVLVVVALSLLAFAAHSYGLGRASLSRDESLSLFQARLGAPVQAGGRSPLAALARADGHPALYLLLLGNLIRLAGESDLALRFPSLAWAALLVPLLYAAGTRFWNRRAGAIAALLGALSPFYLWYARQAGPYAMVAALGLFAIYALDRALEGGRPAWLLAAALGVLAAAYTDHLALVLWPALALHALLARRVPGRTRLTTLLALAGALLLSLPAVGDALRWPLGRGLLPYLVALRQGLPALLAGLAPAWRALWPLDLVFLAVFAIGAFWPAPGRRSALILGCALIPLLALYGAAPAGAGGAGSRLLLLASPAFYLGVGRGLERSSRRLWPVALAAGLAVVAGMAAGAYGYGLVSQAQAGPGYRLVAQTLQLRERTGDLVVADAADSATAFLHYYRGRAPTIAMPPTSADSDEGRAAAVRAVLDAVAAHDRVWLVASPAPSSNPLQPVEAWLKEKGFLVESLAYPGGGWAVEGATPGQASDVRLQLYLTSSPQLAETPASQHPLQAGFGQLRLEGCDLPLHPIAGGERAWVNLYWRTLKPGAAASVALRLVDAQGRQWGAGEEVPYPAFPPAQWPVGRVMRQEGSLLVPPGVPPGWYRLELRLHDLQGRPIEPQEGAGPGPLTLGPLRVEATWAGRVPAPLRQAQHILLGSGMRFGETMALRGYSLGRSQVRPGEWQHVDLYWQIDRPAGRDLSLTLDLVDGRGLIVSSYRTSPLTSEYPPAAWQGGEFLWTQYDLLVPATAQPGPHRLRISVRDESGQQMPIRKQGQFWTWGQGEAWLAAMQVIKVQRDFARPALEHALEVPSTAGIDLLGFDGAPQKIAPGEDLYVTLHWRAVAVPDRSYKISVQLLAADQSTLLAQEDSVPVQWTRPTTGWGPGEIVADTHRLTIPRGTRPQTANLIVAVYDEDTGRRVQWLGAEQIQERVALCKVEIVD